MNTLLGSLKQVHDVTLAPVHPIVLLKDVTQIYYGQILCTILSVDHPVNFHLRNVVRIVPDTFLQKYFLFKRECRVFFVVQVKKLITTLEIYYEQNWYSASTFSILTLIVWDTLEGKFEASLKFHGCAQKARNAHLIAFRVR